MRCPRCDGTRVRVVDSRTARDGRAVRRRRECSDCGARFTTYEYVEERSIQVLKRSGAAEEFDRQKLARSVRLACAKRPVSAAEIERIVDEVEDEISRMAGVEVPSELIGAMVMDRLKARDRVAYVRFASVYRNFQDIDEFYDELQELRQRREREQVAKDQVELPL
ncbi:MAG: transcriptional repressor NrdR [Gemmatimonadetes bacterium]|nr:transcriptional repressor NrdR [Gemmatimonadota bacterium]